MIGCVVSKAIVTILLLIISVSMNVGQPGNFARLPPIPDSQDGSSTDDSQDGSSPGDLSSYPVKYIKTLPGTIGDFIIAPNLTIPSNVSYYSHTVQKPCQCRSLCWSSLNCTAMSYEPDDGDVLCKFTKNRPHETKLLHLQNSTYIFRTGYMEAKLFEVQLDNLVYFIYYNDSTYYTHDEAVNFCKSYPGFRLAVFENETNQLALDRMVEKTGITDAMRASDTNNNQPQLYYPENGTFSAIDWSAKRLICQASPFERGWTSPQTEQPDTENNPPDDD